jgi:hypothetical protein
MLAFNKSKLEILFLELLLKALYLFDSVDLSDMMALLMMDSNLNSRFSDSS